CQLFLVLVVKRLQLFIGDVNVRSHLLADDLGGHNFSADLLFEVFVRDSLLLRGLLQVFHGRQAELLPQLVQPLDGFCLAGDSQVFAFFDQKLAINQVAQQVFLALRPLCLPVRGETLFQLLLVLLFASLEVTASDDRAVYPGNDFVHDVIGTKAGGEQQEGNGEQIWFSEHDGKFQKINFWCGGDGFILAAARFLSHSALYCGGFFFLLRMPLSSPPSPCCPCCGCACEPPGTF